MSGALERAGGRVRRLFVLGAAARPPRGTPASELPGGEPGAVRRPAVAWVVAAGLPVAFALVLIPLRSSLEQSISLLMVVPVLVVAVLGGARLAAVAAVAAAVSFGVLHTEPYYRVSIDDADDAVEMVVLLLVGIVTGWVTDYAQRSVITATVRGRELDAVTAFLDQVDRVAPADLVAAAQRSIGSLLSAQACDWRPGYHGTAAPVLDADGSIMTIQVPSTPTDARATSLPPVIEIPVGNPPLEQGRFVVRTSPDLDVSVEERRAAASIAAALGRHLARGAG